jgi:hypothetical protein
MNNKIMKVKRVFKSYGKTYQSGFQLVLHRIAKHKMHRTPSSLRGRLDTNNLITSKTIIINQSMINFGTMHIKLRMTTMLS